MPGTTAWVLADQLTTSNPALDGADRVLLVQSSGALRAKRFHRQKLHLVLVAMRHFARELEQRGPDVTSATPAFPVMRPIPPAIKVAFCS